MNALTNRVQRTKKIIKLAAADAAQKGCRLELCYSGGKDSEVMRVLAEDAGVDCRVVYKDTTIDQPYTHRWVLDHGAEILRPRVPFLQQVERRGIPSRFVRWCCEEYKEYKVEDVAMVGVRQAESAARRKRYKAVNQCRYMQGKTSQHVSQWYPLLHWGNSDVAEFIQREGLQMHPRYYREDGSLDLTRRLGCIGCPLRGDNGLAEFQEYPGMFEQWMLRLVRWWGVTNAKAKTTFRSPFHLMYFHLYCTSLAVFERFNSLQEWQLCNWLEDKIGCDLTKAYREYVERLF